jgi:iduronate 2-sulfatase
MKYLVTIFGLIALNTFAAPQGSPFKKPNVLFIAVDDLRPELYCYGAKNMHTPNIDRLAARGALFRQAYCQQAVCAPSRNSVMTGLRPDALGIYNLSTFFRVNVPDIVTIPEHFKNNGYISESVGKIYHTGHGNRDDDQSWSVPRWDHSVFIKSLEKINRGDTTGLETDLVRVNRVYVPYHKSDAPEEHMSDAVIAQIAVDRIKTLKDTSFFMAVGFLKPHLQFVAPRKYWDLYDPSTIKIPESSIPEGMPQIALGDFGELRKYHGIPIEGPLNDETSRNLIHGYYACVSMIDAQVGKLLDALDENGLAENTIIVLWGDHGFKLGDYGNWCKHSNVELDTNSPLIIAAPQKKKGIKTNSLVEFVDMYPTLCELAGLAKPDWLEGTSLVPILNNPAVKVKSVAISQYPRGPNREIMGYSMRFGDYRYTRWQKFENPNEVVAVELYDHSKPGVPKENLAIRKRYSRKLDKLSSILDEELSKYKRFKVQ